MKKRVLVGAITAGLVLLGTLPAVTNNSSTSKVETSAVKTVQATASTKNAAPSKVVPKCDGITVKSDCNLENVSYKTYVYHPATAEESHTETVTTYEEKITGYCTLCNDGTFSPTCATGRGACSHHGGVAEWDAPITSNVPVSSSKKVIDHPAKAEFYEKVVK